MRLIPITALILLSISNCWSQPRSYPKTIRAKETYTHYRTSTPFPKRLEEFKRIAITSFDKKDQNIRVSYEQASTGTVMSIYIYPGGPGTENRLRQEYLNSMQQIANIKYGIGGTQYPVKFEEGNVNVNGFASKLDEKDRLSRLVVYECGSWFLKYRVTSKYLDSISFDNLIMRIDEWFPPSSVASSGLLNPKAEIHFAKAAFVDSTMLYITMGEAYKKLEWAMDNVDSLERRTGFPGIYLELHTTAIRERVALWKKSKFSSKPSTDQLMQQYEKLVNSEYLEEYVLDQFAMVLVTPNDLIVDMEGYSTWIKNNPLDIDLNKFYYVISFPE